MRMRSGAKGGGDGRPGGRRARTNLAPPTSPFVGRATELAQLAELFETARLVTVLGPGGMGKTRLAMHHAEAHLASYTGRGAGGVWFVDLSDARDASGALAAAAGVLGVELMGLLSEDEIADAVGRRVARLGRVLIVLDNFERVVTEAGAAVERWARLAPSARFLVTSRVVLGVEGEHTLALGPLSRADATALFVGRARLVRPDDGSEDRALVGAIVDAIDRMPLAIELAASRTRVLSTSELRARLDRPLDVLRGARTEERHGSMRRAILDSVELLSEGSRRVFALASTLRNGFTLEAAEAALGGHAVPLEDVLDRVDELVRTSLLRVQVEGDAPARYGFFETIRDVAEALASEDPARDDVLRAHSRYYASGLGRAALDDLDNLALAHETAVNQAKASGDGEAAGRAVAIAVGLEPLLSTRGLSRQRASLFDETLAALAATEAGDTEALARAHLGRGVARRELGESAAARADFEEASRLASGAGLDGLSALALTRLASLDDLAGDTRGARARLDEALTLLARTTEGDVRALREAEAQLMLGHAHRREASLAAAEAALARAAERYRWLNHDEGLAATTYELAVVDMFAGRRDAAHARFEEGLAVARRGGVRILEGALITARGCLLAEEGKLQAALEHHAEAARIFRDLGSRYREASALHYLATTYVERGEPTEALEVLDQARRRLQGVGAPRYEALMAACAASALAMLGRHEEAADAIARAEAALARVPNEPSLATAVAAHGLVVQTRAGRRPANEAVAEARPLVDATPTDDTRFALRALEAATRSTDATGAAALHVAADGGAFTLPGATEPVTLPSRSPLRRILAHLATLRVEAPGEVASIDDVIRAGWPGEKIFAEAALNRAYVAIATLRKKGLAELLVRTDGGYAISQAVVVRRESAGIKAH